MSGVLAPAFSKCHFISFSSLTLDPDALYWMAVLPEMAAGITQFDGWGQSEVCDRGKLSSPLGFP